jgi:hypothetical protein
MSEEGFFQGVEHIPVPWRERQLHVPVFFQDLAFMSVFLLAPTEKIRSMLPSPRMRPYRITPWHSILSLTTYEYRETDLGPYNELAIGVPVTVDEEAPLFAGSLRKMPSVPLMYVHQMPVTTEIAREIGIEFAGFPKFVADIHWAEEKDWLSCQVKADDQHVLTLRGRKVARQRVPRFRTNPLTFRREHFLRSAWVMSEREMGISRKAEDVSLELGEHGIAESLRELNLGRVLRYQYCPQTQAILTPVFESFAA